MVIVAGSRPAIILLYGLREWIYMLVHRRAKGLVAEAVIIIACNYYEYSTANDCSSLA